MKKKGLIVATIVMVLVLAVSLTTATYAWFTVTDVTTIDAFEIAVVAGNAVNIGVKKNNTYEETPTADMFLNGDVTYAPAEAGTIGGGQWNDGTTGLGSSLDHGIIWGAQSAAVGITSAGSAAEATTGNTTLWTKTGKVVAGNAPTGATSNLSNPVLAMANNSGALYGGTTESSGDYAYLFLGASPTKALTENQLIILIDGTSSSGTIVGMLSAIHVAYRVNGGRDSEGTLTGEWTDVDVFGADKPETTDKVEGNHYSDLLVDVECNLTTEQKASYVKSYTVGENVPTAPSTKAMAVIIDGLTGVQGQIDQIEIVIYLAGSDSDCRDEAKGASGSISIFFHTVEQAA